MRGSAAAGCHHGVTARTPRPMRPETQCPAWRARTLGGGAQRLSGSSSLFPCARAVAAGCAELIELVRRAHARGPARHLDDLVRRIIVPKHIQGLPKLMVST